MDQKRTVSRIAFKRSAFFTRWATVVILALCSVYETVTKMRDPSPLIIILFMLIGPWIFENLAAGRKKRRSAKTIGVAVVLALSWVMMLCWQYFRRKSIVQAFADVIAMRGTEGYHQILPICSFSASILIFLAGFLTYYTRAKKDILNGTHESADI